ncbi:hypothetical protein UFOVP26_114 [uncultured Caudovirales phage]|uniref:Uncharacterized protein n=1 Tax=uncultured Caudovirales phage TaxID=2100421 RepID=A0A6J7WPB4_9CAUD|nr:hypothetical protein UFOVP26_114 [uncultured Caudovirales phage]CAB4124004.1 hypothetical protein UFOVP44_121 [uncultured Caudovirales phage]CAB5219630.1 hypothetical protein UFOVP220_112 [uncultured Caudovirales phage]
MNKLQKYLWNVLIAVDQLINTLIGGDPDETMSSRMGKLIMKRKCFLCKLICKLLDRFEINHCQESIEYDRGSDAVIK